MQVTAELSLYPLQDDYLPIIQAFIDSLQGREGITVVTNAMSTQLCGEARVVFDLVREALEDSERRWGRQVLVCKFIPRELEIAG
ncbi:MAG: hypothetical protein CME40_13025 [Haliea sp.]|nr:hypothetical protein [Haliea sp.]|tara:strand:- start:107755 stop:108009 length:255 start_codon:yes stop_codon:yes gene_type:complete